VPHAELRAPEDAMALYRGKFPETPFVNAKADAVPSGSRPDTPSLGYRSQPAPHAAFAAMITRMDRDIGRIVELLAARGLDRRTLILFTSDNGPHQEGGADPQFFNSSGGLRGIKRDMYEGGIRVPMIARWTDTVRARSAITPGLTGICCPRLPSSRERKRPTVSTASRWSAHSGARPSPHINSSTGSFTNAVFSRRSGWGSGRRSG